MKHRNRKKGSYLEKFTRALPKVAVVVLLCVQGSYVVWCSTVPEVTLIEGEPDSDLKAKFLAKIQTPWPRECDRYCQGIEGCLSFTWSPRDSSCEVYETNVQQHGYVPKDQKFWIAKTFAQSRAGFENYITMTKSNSYNDDSGSDSQDTEPEAKDACDTGDEATTTWEGAKTYCEERGMLLYAPKNQDELASIIQCSKIIDGRFWTGYTKSTDSDYFHSERLMIFSADSLITQSASVGSCLAGTQGRDTIQAASCDDTLKFICQPEYHSEFCENSGNIAKMSELVPGSTAGKKVFISKSPCVSRNGETIKEGEIEGFDTAFRAGVVANCTAVKKTTSCDVYVNDADGYEKCVVVTEDTIDNCASSEKFYLCQTTVFASTHRVKFNDATEVCDEGGGVPVDPDDATNLASELKSVSCPWSMTQTSELDKVIIYEGDNPEVRRRVDSDNNSNYNFYDIAICKMSAV